LRYGDGLFETIKYKNGQWILVQDHLARLWNGMQLLQFDIPAFFNPEMLVMQAEKLIQKNHLTSARIRINVFKGEGGLYDARHHRPNYTIETWSLPHSSGELNENGLCCCIYEEALKSQDRFSNSKLNNFLPYTQGALFAKQKKCNDAIILNHQKNICDSTIANIFIIKEKNIYTPPLSEGCIAGVTRHFILSELKKNNYSIMEKPISVAELFDADEVFFTNAIYTMRWVRSIEDKIYSNEETRKIYAQLRKTNSTIFC
jgi:branched-chain amino acid aminotransferase